MKRSQGFTVIELIVVIAFLGVASALLLVQKGNLTAAQRDSQRKTAINAMYYSLEEAFFEKNGYYPAKINSKTLRTVDPELFTDPNGVKMGEEGATYKYESNNCDNDKCKGYKLSAELEKEAVYTKTNR
jgi:prepilin-type N-terminal cleavage/methylation domain-containing protein